MGRQRLDERERFKFITIANVVLSSEFDPASIELISLKGLGSLENNDHCNLPMQTECVQESTKAFHTQ